MTARWVVAEEVSHDLLGTIAVTFTDGEGWWKARVKDTGCVDLSRFHNEPWGGPRPESADAWDNTDYLHVCDLDDLIGRLQALKVAAKAQFGGEWPR